MPLATWSTLVMDLQLSGATSVLVGSCLLGRSGLVSFDLECFGLGDELASRPFLASSHMFVDF